MHIHEHHANAKKYSNEVFPSTLNILCHSFTSRVPTTNRSPTSLLDLCYLLSFHKDVMSPEDDFRTFQLVFLASQKIIFFYLMVREYQWLRGRLRA